MIAAVVIESKMNGLLNFHTPPTVGDTIVIGDRSYKISRIEHRFVASAFASGTGITAVMSQQDPPFVVYAQ